MISIFILFILRESSHIHLWKFWYKQIVSAEEFKIFTCLKPSYFKSTLSFNQCPISLRYFNLVF